MDFIYFNLDLSLVAYLKAFVFNKNRREKCVTWVVQNYFFSLLLKFPNNGIRAIGIERS